jgi:hypothetical protein
MYRKLSPIILGLGLALALPAVAGAANLQVFPGSMCVRDNGAGIGGTPSLDGTIHGNVNATGELTLLCPIVRDNITQPFLSVAAVVRDRSLDRQVSCQLFSRTPVGGLLGSTTKASGTQAADAGDFTLGFTTPLAQVAGGYYYLRCSIPRQVPGQAPSGIMSYRIDELGTE